VVKLVHAKVPGRARFKVEGLYRSETVKQQLESRLSGNEEITRISASILTGNVLVCFNSGNDYHSIARIVEQAISDTNSTTASTDEPPSYNSAEILPVEKPSKEGNFKGQDSVKSKIRRLFSSQPVQQEQPWHLLEQDTVVAVLDTDRYSGLSSEAAQERLKLYGPNLLPESHRRSGWSIFIDQFKSLPVGLLGIAAGISALTGGLLDAVVIMGVVVANAAIGYFTENESEKTIYSLKRFVRPYAQVIREGYVNEIPAADISLGDLVVLKPGTYVPADCRVVDASHLSIDESALTGESMPVSKTALSLAFEALPLADKTNMVFMGTLVTGGQGLAVVIATGSSTEMGRLQLILNETAPPEAPIAKQLDRVGEQLVLIGVAICGLVFTIGWLRGYGLLQMLRMSICLAGAAVPEGLPAAATTTFALGIRRMREHHVLIRDLEAVETLGAVQTVCLDKTGTITRNRMAVLRIHSGMKRFEVNNGHILVDGKTVDLQAHKELLELIRAGALCNETQINGKNGRGTYELSGTATENALIHLAEYLEVDVVKLRAEYPLQSINHRSETRLFMSTLHSASNGDRLLALKGSPNEVLAMCSWQMKGGKKVPLTEDSRLEIEAENERMAGQALRVLGLASSYRKNGHGANLEEKGLTWLGLIGMADPIREGVRQAIKAFHEAGVRTVMITGDQSPTAYAVAQELDLSNGEPLEILDSSQLTAVEADTMKALGQKVFVYSRVSPAHKLRIVQALQAAGMVVAMTGDGINDGPALKAAEVGIAMGHSGTDVAREVADVVLEEDNLETLIVAIRDGRTTYTNTKKAVHFFVSTNMSEIMVMFAAIAAGVGSPLNTMQLLWINAISDIFPGLALALEAPEQDVLQQPPRDPKEPILTSSDYKRMALESAIISGGALGAYAYGLARYGVGARSASLAFHSLTVGQLLHALSCRSRKRTIFDRVKPPPNRYLNTALLGSLALQLLTVFVPGLRNLLGLSLPTLTDTAVIGGAALLPLAVNEMTKTDRRGINAEKQLSYNL
jgi:Ca2+-transporting ATPase